jgi:hypothetical protein
MNHGWHVQAALISAVIVGGCAGMSPPSALVSQAYEQSYLPASHNWAFRRHYPQADHLFNAFDYGHAMLSEVLYTQPGAPTELLDHDRFRFIVDHVLSKPPAVPLEERAIAPRFSRLAPEVELVFEWAHMLHRQIYDVWADDRISERAKDVRIAELITYYQSRSDLALSAKPKTMAPMESRPYSTAFRKRYPTFNGLIWSYHWLQLALYEVLMSDASTADRRVAVRRTLDRFESMLACPSTRLPRTMPMAAAVAPRFAERYPEAAAIFDNLHSLHDVVSDILVSSTVSAGRKRDMLLAAAAEYRSSTAEVTTVEAWREMAQDMGVSDMGGSGAALGNVAMPRAPCGSPGPR